jgi:hypothetical protein
MDNFIKYGGFILINQKLRSYYNILKLSALAVCTSGPKDSFGVERLVNPLA